MCVFAGVLAAVASSASAQTGAAIPTFDAGLLRAARSPAPDGTTAADELVFDGSLARALSGVALETRVRVNGWPVAPAVRKNVLLALHDVYAPGAQVFRVDGSGLTELPRSRLKFFSGAAEGEAHTQVLIVLDPAANAVWGFSDLLEGTHELLPPARPGAGQILARSDALVPQGTPPLSADCSQGDMPPRSAERAARLAEQDPAAAITSLHTATVAVDTDNELMLQKFSDNTTSATNYLATLIATMNIMYERDLLVRLVQGQTFLRVSTTPDPYSVNSGTSASRAELEEFGNFWIATNAAIPRALAMMLSGKQPSATSASGIAWLDALCAKGSGGSPFGGYSFSKVFKFVGSTGASDAKLVGHELGHNFGSPHTHCTLPGDAGPIDMCHNAEAGCFSGPTSCPAPATFQGVPDVRGTVMSYCHLLGGCTAASVFHPRTIQFLNPLVEEAATGPSACIVPATVTRTVCPSGCTHTKIQDAVNASAANEIVLIKSTYDSLVAAEVFPITTTAIGSAGPITIMGEVDGSGNPTTTVRTRNGPSAGFNIVSPGSVLKDLKILPGDGTTVAKVITASRSGGTCPGATCHLNGLTVLNVVIDFSTTFTATNGIDVRADNLLIDKVTVKGIAGSSILVDGDNATIRNSTLNGLNAGGTAQTGLVGIAFGADQKSVTGAACTGFPTNYGITTNTITGFTQSGIKWCLGRNATVTSNVISNILDKAIDTAGSQDSLIQGNAISWTLSGGTHGIGLSTTGLQTCDGNKVIGNRVTGRVSPRDLQRAIVVQSCLNSSVIGNVMEFLAGNESLWVTAPAGVGTHNVVQGNTVQEGNGNGVVYSGADVASTALDTSFVRDNVVLNHGKNGIVVSNLKGPGSVIAYNIVRGNNLELAANQHGFNVSGLSGTVFAANEGLQTLGPAAAGFFFANSQNIVGSCNFGGGNAGGLLVQSNVTPAFFSSNAFCRYGLYNHFDFDADGKSDQAVYRNSTGQWIIRPSATPLSPLVVPFGDPPSDDIPAPGNYNSPTRTDIAVYRYTTGQWIIRNAGTGGLSVIPFGSPADGDIPVPGKYTQTSLSEIAVFRSSTAVWLIKPAGGGAPIAVAWGCPSCADIPVPFDFDGDGLVDIAVYRRSAGEWYIRKSSDGTLLFLQFGDPLLGDLPVPGNFSTPTKTDVAVYRSLLGQWLIRNSLTGATSTIPFGTPAQGDVPVPADYTVAGTSDIGVFRLLTGDWFIRRSTDFGMTTLSWGSPPFLDSPLMAR